MRASDGLLGDPHDDLDALDGPEEPGATGVGTGARGGAGGGAGGRPRASRRRLLLGAGAALAAAVAVGARHTGAPAPPAPPAPPTAATPAPALPGDVAADQRIAVAAFRVADPRLTRPDWAHARTDARRDPAARTADGTPLLVDVVQVAPIVYGGRTFPDVRRGSGVGYRISTPLRPPRALDACRAEGVVVPPLLADGTPEPACIVVQSTSRAGEVQRVALREWQQSPPAGSGAAKAAAGQPQWVRQAVLVTHERWTFAVATTTVGAQPELDASELDLAVRWMADDARGLPTPSTPSGPPLPGSDG